MALTLPIKIASTIGKPVAVYVEQAIDKTTKQGAPCGVPAWDWDGQGNVIIRALPSLPTGTYTVSFRLVGG